MSEVLLCEQREQAGSDSYNRFEYQVFWIAKHILSKIDSDSDAIVFCEFHDDMAELDNKRYSFYQVKTKEKESEWSLVELSKKEKSKKEKNGYKKSFLGFLFYNFLKFKDECFKCYFVSNRDFDREVREWQAYIEDELNLKTTNNELYNKIKSRIRNEYVDLDDELFDSAFEVFIQNTFMVHTDLSLEGYEKQVQGYYFTFFKDKDISTRVANLIFEQILNDVRIKSKAKIQTPISLKKLTSTKGVNIPELREKIQNSTDTVPTDKRFNSLLIKEGLDKGVEEKIIQAKIVHDRMREDVTNIKYEETVLVIKKVIIALLDEKSSNINAQVIVTACRKALQEKGLLPSFFDETLIGVLYYEQKFNNKTR